MKMHSENESFNLLHAHLSAASEPNVKKENELLECMP